MRIGVIGGGLAGVGTALELSLSGHRVELFEREAACLTQASRQNEGKIHLGFVYGQDPSLATARLMARGAYRFAPLLQRWLGLATLPMVESSAFHYFVHRDSLQCGDTLSGFYARVIAVLDEERARPGTRYVASDEPLAGGEVRVGAASSALRLLGAGWSLPEPWGTWTNALMARIELPPLDTASPLRITLVGQPFLGGLGPGDRRRMVVSCGAVRQERTYGPDEPWQAPVVVMDAETARHGGIVSVEMPDAQSPAGLGLSPDPRPLGLALTAIVVAPVPGAPLQVSLHPPI